MLADLKSRRVAVVGYNRIPFARQNTFYADKGNQAMMTAALNGLIDRYHLSGMLLGEVAGGAVIKHSREINLMRECVLGSSLDHATAAVISSRPVIPVLPPLSISHIRSPLVR